MKIFHKQNGISLLELMLSLAIIGILIVTAGRYYSTARSTQQVNDAVSMLQTVMSATDNWYYTYKTYTPTTPGSISITMLAEQGLVPSEFTGSNVNPWGGAVIVSPNATSNVTIELTNVNSNDCTNLAELMLKRGLNGTCTEQASQSSNYSAVYSSSGNTSSSSDENDSK